jgi:hypothetical protein
MAGTKQAMAATYKTLVVLISGGTTSRAMIYDVLVGTNGTPADNPLEFNIERQTAAGTATAATPVPTDPLMRACLSTAGVNATAEGTIAALTTSLFYIGMNQRASYRWVAAPGSELIVPAVAAAGLALRALSATYTGTSTGHYLFEE